MGQEKGMKREVGVGVGGRVIAVRAEWHRVERLARSLTTAVVMPTVHEAYGK